ncbi:glutamate racemase [Akkermansiaceae bacterium]|nr:glutamate racemase [Akkermansiaceae bacterium]
MEPSKPITKTPSRPPVGVIDSGVGGLSVLTELNKVFSGTQFHYIADSAWCPYGDKSAESITQRVSQLTEYLITKGCGSIVIACNSATISAVEYLRTAYPLPFTGMEPAIKPAAQHTKNQTIGILATEASLSGERFLKLLNTHGKGIKIITRPCPKFVELVEKGITCGEEVDSAIRLYTAEMVKQGADVVVLGCTHYPFLKQSIQRILGKDVLLIDTGLAVATQTLHCYEEQFGKTATSGENTISIQTSADLEQLIEIFPKLCPSINATFHPFDLTI